MKIAIMSDIHDNLPRLKEAIDKAQGMGIKICILTGDIQTLDTLGIVAENFSKVYLALGNGDYAIDRATGLIPKNIVWAKGILDFRLGSLECAAVHYDYLARDLAQKGGYDYVFYGHTHTPWEKTIGKTKMVNPGEVAGQFGKATFAILDTSTHELTLCPLG